jgi:hypothetical protein
MYVVFSTVASSSKSIDADKKAHPACVEIWEGCAEEAINHVNNLPPTPAMFPSSSAPSTKVTASVALVHDHCFAFIGFSHEKYWFKAVSLCSQGSAGEQSSEAAFARAVCEPVDRLFRFEVHQLGSPSPAHQWQSQIRGTVTDSQVCTCPSLLYYIKLADIVMHPFILLSKCSFLR